MTLFEIIILFLIYVFCLVFSVRLLIETPSSEFGKFLLCLLMVVIAPILTILVIGVYLANVINESVEV